MDGGGGGEPPYVEATSLVAVASARDDIASFLRGKAWIAGVRDDTPLADACDVYFTLEVEGVPKDEMKKWRRRMDQQLRQADAATARREAQPDRATWGLLPDQQAQMAKLMGTTSQ